MKKCHDEQLEAQFDDIVCEEPCSVCGVLLCDIEKTRLVFRELRRILNEYNKKQL